jgi:hypothetical protein
MIMGAHIVITSAKPEADHAFLRDILKLPHVDEGGVHELFLMCDDVKAFVAGMQKRSIACSAIKDQGWGLLTQVTLPGGGRLGVYQPRHARPKM